MQHAFNSTGMGRDCIATSGEGVVDTKGKMRSGSPRYVGVIQRSFGLCPEYYGDNEKACSIREKLFILGSDHPETVETHERKQRLTRKPTVVLKATP